MKKTLLILFFFLCFLIECNKKAENTRIFSSKIEVKDFRNKTISLSAPATRVVCLLESALSGIFMLKVQDKVVGISTNVYNGDVAKHYAALDERIKNKKIPAPGNWDFVNLEKVIALNPDLVIIWASQTETITALEQLGIPVYAVMLKSFKDVYKEIQDFGILFNVKERADSLVKYVEKKLEECSSLPFPKKRQKVYFMWAQGPYETSGTESTVNELITRAGAINACPLPDEHIVVDAERIIQWEPDVIVMWVNEKMDPKDIYSLSSLRSIPAVKNKRVFELPSVFYCDLWTLKCWYAVRLVTSWCYPELTESIDLEKEKIEMLQVLYGKSPIPILK